MTDPIDDIKKERDWLMTLVTEAGHQPVTDAGIHLVAAYGDFVYETPQGRYEVKVRRLPGDHSS